MHTDSPQKRPLVQLCEPRRRVTGSLRDPEESDLMRLKIILPNAIVVLLIGLISFYAVRARLAGTQDTASLMTGLERGANNAAGAFQLQLLRAERWLGEQTSADATRAALANGATADADKRQNASETLETLRRAAADAKVMTQPDLAFFVDEAGRAAGRSAQAQTYHGDDFAAEYPALKAALKDGRSGSDVWLSPKFAHRYLVSYAPVRDASGKALGMLGVAWNLNDQRMAEIGEGATFLSVLSGGAPVTAAKANVAIAPTLADDLAGSQQDVVKRALTNGKDTVVIGGTVVSAAPLQNVGDGKRAVIVLARKADMVADPNAIVWPILPAMGLGLIFVLIAGWLLGSYVTEPVGKMEETLLQVINGNTNQRVQTEHAELGGLAFRINQLLNQVLGVEEDNTDEEGRPSAPPAPEHFQEALGVEERSADAGQVAALAAEPEAQYYARIYREYIDAKRANGEGVEGITQDVFVNRIRGMERDAAAKFGKPVRYAVQRRERQVVLLAIPLA